jgi:hypothetical protein
VLEDGLFQPLLQADLAESRAAAWNQRALAEFDPVVPRVRICDYAAGVVARAEGLTDQFIETEFLGTGHFNGAMKNFITAASSNDGEFETSTTTDAP